MEIPSVNQGTELDSTRLLRAVYHVQQVYIRGQHSVKEVFDILLSVLLELTESEYGFIGKVPIDNDGKPYLKILAITDTIWNEETRALYEKQKAHGIEFTALRHLTENVLRTEKPYIDNALTLNADKHSIPNDYSALNAFLGVPIVNGEMMIGMFGIANRVGGYTPEMIEFLAPLTDTCAVLIQAFRERQEHEWNIAQLQLAHDNLHRNEQFLRSLVESQTSYLIRTDMAGQYTYINKGFSEHFGLQEKLLGMNSMETIHPDDIPACIATVERCFTHPGEMQHLEIRKPHLDGVSYLETEWEFIAVCDAGGAPYEIQCVGRDITGRKEAERLISELNQNLLELNETLESRVDERTERLRALNREKDEVMGIAAHDLKNPLSAIKLSTELILRHHEHGTPNNIPRIAKNINQASEQMLDIIKNLLELNNIENGTFHLESEFIDSAFIEEIINDYQTRSAEKGLVLVYEHSETIRLKSDKRALRHLMDNLVSNAVKFSPAWTTINVRLLKRAADDGSTIARLEVQDQGPGLTEADHKLLFTKFARLSARPTGGEHSTGLGLSIVKKLVEMQNGRVWCESEHGKGATFIVELPMGTA